MLLGYASSQRAALVDLGLYPPEELAAEHQASGSSAVRVGAIFATKE